MTHLTDKERTHLLTPFYIPDHFQYWCYRVATSSNPTEQQVKTARQIIAMNAWDRYHHYLWADKLHRSPKAKLINLQKVTVKIGKK